MIRSRIWHPKTNTTSQTIYKDHYYVSNLIEKKWLHKLIGTWGNSKYVFKYTINLNTSIKILNDEYKELGKIKINFWGTKAKIFIDDKVYQWNAKNMLRKQWHIKSKEQSKILNDKGQFFSNDLPKNHRGILNLSGHAVQHFNNHYLVSIFSFIIGGLLIII
ncbi:hypothetical protein KMW28_25765 [Flammeovirga yaeyamensis]|uniref:Uncharacterized protein n=1 Tax=Flammeovirga yaeyamensis TaxID=367791 RepID=A0AAX1N9T6_9BACT|nr:MULTISPECIES: hypothetical protein [Flammeovirga]ANQ52039.1 hypothetical protein MY04_4704 [Flammeovirga sp. MY04]MBB3699293.1 hypothetical protein [Flammeovirga yaeyamensis]NMF35444.1 hypothetical protein [Flammeovirga yaeyamensis]QWG04304.1 hypothetical protein KMW28_25765 [Flammeovirga yaeyamensis]